MKDHSAYILQSLSEQLSRTPQPKQWHGEGDVLTHTRLVCEALRSLPEYRILSEVKQELLMSAARLHDIGKIPTTQVIADRIEAPNHAPVGSRMARTHLWLAGMSGQPELIRIRETICQLIRYHSFPPHAIDAEDVHLRLHRISANALLLPFFSLRLLCMLAKADMLGRQCDDKHEVMDRIALCEELAKEEGCLEGCFRFPSNTTMHAFLSGRNVWKGQRLHDETWGTVYMMSGLPGTGKDTWIQRNIPDLPMISLDDIRKEIKVTPTDNQGYIANIAKDRAKEFLRRHQPFVWNATNITQTLRRQLISLFEDYKAKVHIVYVETDWQTLLARNTSREAVVPQSAIETMLHKLEPPEIYEASQVSWISH